MKLKRAAATAIATDISTYQVSLRKGTALPAHDLSVDKHRGHRADCAFLAFTEVPVTGLLPRPFADIPRRALRERKSQLSRRLPGRAVSWRRIVAILP